jgi:hypothetical protein
MRPDLGPIHADLAALCRSHGVRTLELIGSAARGDFDPERSDYDFLVEFERDAPGALSDRYFGVLFGLEDLLGRKVDLIRVSARSDPRFMAVARRHVNVIYDARSPQAA